MRFAALGRTKWLHDAISACREAGHELVLVGTGKAAPEYGATEDDFRALAESAGCLFFQGTLSGAHLDLLRGCGAQVAISANWPVLIPPEVTSLFAHGVVNAHAGDLPRYRGNACPNWAILQGESEVVLTLHQVVPELDAGSILIQRPFALDESTYIGDVYSFMAEAIPAMFAQLLDELEAGTLQPTPQPGDPALALRCYPRRPEDGFLDWRESAIQLARLVRASAEPFAGAFTLLDGRRLIVWRARPEPLPCPSLGVPGQVTDIDARTGQVRILTGGGLLVLELVEQAVGGRCAPASLIRSTRTRLGTRPGQVPEV